MKTTVLTNFYLYYGQSHRRIDWTEVSKPVRATWNAALIMPGCLGSNVFAMNFKREPSNIFIIPHFSMEKLLSQGHEKWNHLTTGSSPIVSWFVLHMLHHNTAVTLPARADSPSEPATLFRQLIARNTCYKPCFISFPLIGIFHSALGSFKHRGHTHSTL